MTDAELRGLLADCLVLWGVEGVLRPEGDGWAVETGEGAFSIERVDPDLRPARWALQTPERRGAGRPPRMAPSIVAAKASMRPSRSGSSAHTGSSARTALRSCPITVAAPIE